VPRVGVDVVGPEPGLHQLDGGIAFPDRPLARSEHADAGRTLPGDGLFPFLGHDIKGFVPTDRLKVAVLVINAIGLAQKWRGRSVVAVHDLGQEIALDAVQATVHRRVRVALGGDDAAILDPDQHRTAGAAEPAGPCPDRCQRPQAVPQRRWAG
jgi:hypothetical protein